ncbi:MAG: 5-formyltetrahydrofolate cyclo-ligase [Ruminococcaceae bacterium]|nr:5-formyltetrahydrofolate cyclo-ligase [Oscillospiraceae bacterium]
MTKQELRGQYLQKRQEAPPALLEQLSEAIAAHVLRYVKEQGVKAVMAYADVRNEPKTEKLIRALLRENVCVGLPKCGTKGKMEAFRLRDWDELTTGRYGILEPGGDEFLAPEGFGLVLVPGSCFGFDMNRLGYGGGYYDRYLPRCRNAVYAGVCYGFCMEETVPRDDFDIPMDFVFTEAGLVTAQFI